MKCNILILCDFNRSSANTIIDHATCFKKYSRHNIFYFNPVGKDKPEWLNLARFDFLIIHYSIYILGDSYINDSWRSAIAESPAVKIQFIQDEYRRVNAITNRMRELKVKILYTCFPEQEIEKVYSEDKLPGVKKINTLTGYVPSYLDNSPPDFRSKRPIDVGYRGRGEGLWWLGTLYQEKSFIGREFLRYARETDLVCDISTREEDRIYGRHWLHFLRKCRCTLGTESGASVIDFTGEVEEAVRCHCHEHPEASFEEVRDRFFRDIEGTIRMNQISPRAFEAIGCGCCMILFEGEYSKILKPGVHYIELKKDFGNIQDVFDRIRDSRFTKEMSRRAYTDIILPGTHSYQAFVASFDKDLDDFMAEALTKPAAITAPPPHREESVPASCHGAGTALAEAASTSTPLSITPTGPFCTREISLAFQRVIASPCITKGRKLTRYVLYVASKCVQFGYRCAQQIFFRVAKAVLDTGYNVKYVLIHQYHRLKGMVLYHPFFHTEKWRLIAKIFKEM